MSGTRKLTVEIVGESASAERALKNTKHGADSLVPSSANAHASMGKLTDQLTSRLPVGGTAAKNALGKITAGLGEMGPGMAAGIGGAALLGAALIKMAADGVAAQLKLGAEVRSLQKITAGTAEDTSKLRYEFVAMGIDSGTAASALGKLAKNINTNAAALKDNGVEIALNKNGTVDMNATLASGAEAFKNAKSATERAAIGNALFGKSWVTMAPLLMKGKEGLGELNKEAERYHQVLTQGEIDKTAEFSVALRHTNMAVDSLKRGIGDGLIGSMSGLLNVIEPTIHAIDELQRSTNFAGGAMMGFIEGVASASGPFGTVIDIVNVFGQSNKKSAEEIKKMSDAELQAAAAGGDDADATAELTDRTEANARQTKAATDRINEQTKALNDSTTAQMATVDSGFALLTSTEAVKTAQNDYTTAVNNANAAGGQNAELNQIVQDKQSGLTSTILSSAQAWLRHRDDVNKANGITETASQRAAAYKQHLTDMANAAGGPVRDQILWLIGTINAVPDRTVQMNVDTSKAWEQLDRLDQRWRQGFPSSSYVGGVSGVTTTGSAGFRRAGGGPVAAGGMYLVGEEGPEMVRFGRSGTVLPNKRITGALTSSNDSGGGGNLYSITVNTLDARSAGSVVVAAIQEYERRNSTSWRS